MRIPFTKAHGAKNDFLLTWGGDGISGDLPRISVAICDRHTGVGADGWMIVTKGTDGCDGTIRLFNSDGSEPEMSGNGTRCAAAFLMEEGLTADSVRVRTGAGPKELRLLSHEGPVYRFEMNMGRASVSDVQYQLPLEHGSLEVTILNVGNPQCAVVVKDFEIDWRRIGAEIEKHSHFPNRTNVSFIRVVDRHTIDVRFFERGAGETMSSGTGSTGAAAAAMARGLVEQPVTILTPAGPMTLRQYESDLYLSGPAEIIARGEFYL